MLTNDDEEKTEELNEAIAALYWSILRNMEEYKKDYKELQKDYNELQDDYDGKEMWFTDKWSLLEPIDPKKDNPNPFYFFRDNQPFMPAQSKGLSESPYAPYALTIELDIRRDLTTLKEEIGDIIIKEKLKALNTKEPINLIGEEKPQKRNITKMYYMFTKKKLRAFQTRKYVQKLMMKNEVLVLRPLIIVVKRLVQ